MKGETLISLLWLKLEAHEFKLHSKNRGCSNIIFHQSVYSMEGGDGL